MDFAVTCTQCGKRYELNAALAGKRGRCKQCGHIMRLEADAPAGPASERSRPRGTRREDRANRADSRGTSTAGTPADPFGLFDAPAPAPEAPERVWSDAPRRIVGHRRARATFEWPQIGFGHAVLGWFLTIVIAAGLGFVLPDGVYRSARFTAWLGIALMLAGSFWLIVTAFREHVAHGLMVLFVPFYSLVYLSHNWSEASRPFWTGVGGLLMVCLSGLFYSAMGADVGTRGLLWTRTATSPRGVGERDLPLRPPAVSAETPRDEAQRRWREFMASLSDDHASVLALARRKEKRMAARYGADRVVTVYVLRVYDADTFDALVHSLRRFAGPDPNDFFACTNAGWGDRSTLMVVLAPVNDLQALADSIDVGGAPGVMRERRTIQVVASGEHIPAQFLEEGEPITAGIAVAAVGTAVPGSQAVPAAVPGTPVVAPRAIQLSREGPLNLPLPPSVEVVKTLYSATTSRYVAVGDNAGKDSYRESWDLQERRRIGVLAGKLALHGRLALSPDGTLLTHMRVNQEVEIWSFLTGTLVRRLNPGTVVDMTAFVSPDQLLVSTPFQNTYHLYDVRTGQKLRSVVARVGIDTRSPAVSPDGKSLALSANGLGFAGVYSLESGRLTADWIIPRSPRRATMPCEGMAFSPDGSELGALFDDTKYARFMTWDATGALIFNALVPYETAASVPKPILRYLGRPLEWLPDRSGWLVYGRVFVDKQTGKPAWKLPENPDDSPIQPRRLLETGELLMVSGPRGAEVLRGVPLPLDQINQAIQAVRSP